VARVAPGCFFTVPALKLCFLLVFIGICLMTWMLDLLFFICDRLRFIVKRGLMSALCNVCLLFE
jgi:hypothetical protein